MSFILDALRKSDQRRRSSEGPGLASAPVEVTGEVSRRSKRGGRIGLLLLVAIVVTAVIAYVERDRLDQQWTAWTGQNSDPEAGAGVSRPADPSLPDDRASEPGIDPAVAAFRERVQTPRERVISDPNAAQAEVERLVAAQNASPAADESPVVVDRRSPTPSLAGQSVSRAAPTRDIPTAPSVEEAARIERRLLEARQRAQQALAGGASSDSQDGNDRSAEVVPERSAGGRADPEDGLALSGKAAAEAVPASGNEMPRPQDRSVDGQEAPAISRTDGAGPVEQQEAQWAPQAAEYVRAWELPLSIRRSLPAMTLNIHVFSELPEERFVLINGERYVSGDELVDGAQLVDIRREGAVVDYRDYRFLLEP
jgi:general secretion pathway protein B